MSAVSTVPKQTLDIRAFGLQFLFIAIVLGVPFGLATAPSIFRDGDVSWQIAAGQWILRNGRIPTSDPFSFTAAGHPWVAMEWLAEIFLAGMFGFAGFAGLATIVAAAVMATFGIIFFYLQRRTSALVLTSTLLALSVALAPFALARPHVLAWPLLAGWTVLLLRAAEAGKPPPLWAALLLVVWTNLHASFPLSLPIAGAVGLDALISQKWANLRAWLAFGSVSLIALTLNANGLTGLEQPFRTSSMAMLPYISEWQATSTSATPYFFGVLLFGLVLSLWARVRVPIGRLLLLLSLLGLALLHVRHQSSFMIVSACFLPPLWRTRPGWNPAPIWLAAIAVPFLGFRLMMPLVPPEGAANPRSLISAIPPPLRSQPVFNAYTFGGPLILAGIRPYIDGRAEIYGDAFVIDYVHITHGDVRAFNIAVRRYHIRWAILQQTQGPLLKSLELTCGWRRIYSDQVGAILIPNRTSKRRTGACGEGVTNDLPD